jgi:hypothetical protein
MSPSGPPFARPLPDVRSKKEPGPPRNGQTRPHKHTPSGSDDQPTILINGMPDESLNTPLAASHLLRIVTAGRIGARLRARIEAHGDPRQQAWGAGRPGA